MKTQKSQKKYTLVSLFAGCGGLDLGFKGDFSSLNKNYEKRNFDFTWVNDFDKNACLTFEKYFKEPIVCGDIVNIVKGSYPDLFSHKLPERADVVIGGFPCQSFSLAGLRKGFDDKRGILYQSMVEIVRRLKPAVFVAENVKGLLSMNGGEAIEIIKKDFEALGYNVEYKLFHVADFGVPQNRERVIIVGTSKEKKMPTFSFPKPTHSKDSWVTVGEAIGDLETVEENSLPNHSWSKAKMFVGTQGNSIIKKDKIAPTMRAEHHGNIEWHWNEKRRLSAREAARIQTFPDDFIFYPSTSSAYKQIGNAVPPVFGWHVAKAVEDFLDKHLTN
jgi:DNA (cytosine-5)-methyltransferase 1